VVEHQGIGVRGKVRMVPMGLAPAVAGGATENSALLQPEASWQSVVATHAE
jgi:hypothetical protein